MVRDHTRTERGMCVACWSGFPSRVYIDLNHRDSYMSNRLFVVAST
jgi:hypothetical protein